MDEPQPPPIPDAYWASPGTLLAGPYPWLTCEDRAAQRASVRALLSAGIQTVIDLRTPAEPPSVRSLLRKLADRASWVGLPIQDGMAPSEPHMQLILDLIDASIARDRAVYLHCQGGRGRTGCVIACWWIRHGHYDAEAAVAELMRRRVGQPNGGRVSPETSVQRRLVERWEPGL